MEEIIKQYKNIISLLDTFSYIIAIVSVVLFIVLGFALYSMSKKLKLSKPWISFIPFAQVFNLGRIAEKYIKPNGKKNSRYSMILLILSILEIALFICFFIFFFFAVYTSFNEINKAIENDIPLTIGMFSSFIPCIVIWFINITISIIYTVYYYIALWRIYYIFNQNVADIYLVISIFFSFLAPIFAIVISRNIPYFEKNNNQWEIEE